MKKHKAKNREPELSFITEEKAQELLKKYDRIIFAEAKRRRELPGIGFDDLVQICRERLLEGFKSFDQNKGSEKTWASSVIKKTLNGIWKRSLRKKRVNTENRREEEGFEKEYPVLDMSISDIDLEHISIPNDERTIFSTSSIDCPEKNLELLETIEILKKSLPADAYKLIKDELFPDLEEKIQPSKKDYDFKIKDRESYPIWTRFSNLQEEEIGKLNQISDVFINVLGYEKSEIFGRSKTIDLAF